MYKTFKQQASRKTSYIIEHGWLRFEGFLLFLKTVIHYVTIGACFALDLFKSKVSPYFSYRGKIAVPKCLSKYKICWLRFEGFLLFLEIVIHYVTIGTSFALALQMYSKNRQGTIALCHIKYRDCFIHTKNIILFRHCEVEIDERSRPVLKLIYSIQFYSTVAECGHVLGEW